VNGKIAENLPVHFEIMPIAKAKQLGAIGLFDEKYAEDVKVYFVGDYSKELCGGPHVDFTSEIKQFKIIKQENIGHGQRRIYSTVGD
jgi:alanyl-tRNA synthetase